MERNKSIYSKCAYGIMAYITFDSDNKLKVPNRATIGYIEGDGIGPDITKAMINTVNASIEIAYSGERSIEWEKVNVG
jgi:isocitrate dehydrogenase